MKLTRIERTTGKALCLCVCAIAAFLAEPSATHADTFYVSNWDNDVIVKFTADGFGSTFYSGPSYFRPTGLTFDSAGNLYAASRYAWGISKFTPDGTRSPFGNGIGLNYPRGMAFDGAGNL